MKFCNPSWLDIEPDSDLPSAGCQRLVTWLQTVVCKQSHESLIGQCEDNITQRFLLVSLLWYQMALMDNSPILSKNLYSGLSSLLIHWKYMLFWISISHTFTKVKAKIILLSEIDVVCDHLQHTKKLFVTNSVQNYILNTLRQTSKIYLEWSSQLM